MRAYRAYTEIKEKTSEKKAETLIKRGLKKKVKLLQQKVRRQNKKITNIEVCLYYI